MTSQFSSLSTLENYKPTHWFILQRRTVSDFVKKCFKTVGDKLICSLLSGPNNHKSCSKSQSIHQREKFDTAIESLPLIRIVRICNAFTSRTLSKRIRFWICKDQNDSLHTAQHAKPLGGHIWSHFDWQFQSRRDQNPEFAFSMQSKHLFQYNSPKSKNGEPNFLYVVKDL